MNKIIIIAAILFNSMSINGQENEFNRAVELYKSGKSSEALKSFQNFVTDYQTHPKSSAAEYFISSLLLDQAKYSEAEKRINNFIINNSSNSYLADFLHLKIKLNYDQLKYEEAFRAALNLVEITAASDENERDKSLAKKIALNHLSSSQIRSFADNARDRKIKPYLLLVLGKKFLLENDNVNAIRSFNEIISSYNTSDEFNEAERLKSGISNLTSYGDTNILIGVMLPMGDSEGRVNPTGLEILEGIKFAVSEYNKNRENKIGILIRDTRGREENIKAIKEEFVNNSSVRCIIGPVFSDEVRIALEEFRTADLPMISPTATDEELTGISSNFFQANPTFSIRGRIFAQYLYYVENKRRMAVLNAIDGYSPLLATSFIDEFEKLGGEIVSRETYRSNNFSLGEQIKNIASHSNVIDGIYIPLADKTDATAILSQLVQSEIIAPLYGNQDWMLVKGFETSTELSNKLTFTSDYYIDFNDEAFKNFTAEFQQITGKEVNRNILYGYDTAKYLLTVMRNIDPSRKAIKLKMESGISSVGLKNNISFDQSHINKYLNIVRYQDGIFLLVDKFRSGR